MLKQVPIPNQVYTPEQVARILQLNKNTVYDLINRGEIIAKRLGKVYRIPAQSISFAFTGMDEDILKAEQKDLKNLKKINRSLRQARKQVWKKTKSF
jgi:excisionase family DNA binding protein